MASWQALRSEADAYRAEWRDVEALVVASGHSRAAYAISARLERLDEAIEAGASSRAWWRQAAHLVVAAGLVLAIRLRIAWLLIAAR